MAEVKLLSTALNMLPGLTTYSEKPFEFRAIPTTRMPRVKLGSREAMISPHNSWRGNPITGSLGLT